MGQEEQWKMRSDFPNNKNNTALQKNTKRNRLMYWRMFVMSFINEIIAFFFVSCLHESISVFLDFFVFVVFCFRPFSFLFLLYSEKTIIGIAICWSEIENLIFYMIVISDEHQRMFIHILHMYRYSIENSNFQIWHSNTNWIADWLNQVK